MARVHMFKSSDKQTKDIVAVDNLPASPSLPDAIQVETTSDTVDESPNSDNASTLLQKASHDIEDVVSAVAAALSIQSSKSRVKYMKFT